MDLILPTAGGGSPLKSVVKPAETTGENFASLLMKSKTLEADAEFGFDGSDTSGGFAVLDQAQPNLSLTAPYDAMFGAAVQDAFTGAGLDTIALQPIEPNHLVDVDTTEKSLTQLRSSAQLKMPVDTMHPLMSPQKLPEIHASIAPIAPVYPLASDGTQPIESDFGVGIAEPRRVATGEPLFIKDPIVTQLSAQRPDVRTARTLIMGLNASIAGALSQEQVPEHVLIASDEMPVPEFGSLLRAPAQFGTDLKTGIPVKTADTWTGGIENFTILENDSSDAALPKYRQAGR